MFTLADSFNGIKISNHRTVLAAVKAKRLHGKAVKRANGSSSYLTYRIEHANGGLVDSELLIAAEMEIDCAR